jgi:catechol-2,3-dioxygenase
MAATTHTTPAPARGISHVVLNVRDIEAAHVFWTEVMGWQFCAQLHDRTRVGTDMRFYRCSPEHHHDIAVVQVPDPAAVPPVQPWGVQPTGVGLNHVAISYDREAWLRQLAHLQARGVPFERRVNHGMSHSVYITDPDGNGLELLYDLPAEVWAGDVDAAINYAEALPLTGPEALVDSTDYERFTRAGSVST